jgi:hypothetical protein
MVAIIFDRERHSIRDTWLISCSYLSRFRVLCKVVDTGKVRPSLMFTTRQKILYPHSEISFYPLPHPPSAYKSHRHLHIEAMQGLGLVCAFPTVTVNVLVWLNVWTKPCKAPEPRSLWPEDLKGKLCLSTTLVSFFNCGTLSLTSCFDLFTILGHFLTSAPLEFDQR